MLFFFKQKTAYEIQQGDWSSDVCSSDLRRLALRRRLRPLRPGQGDAGRDRRQRRRVEDGVAASLSPRRSDSMAARWTPDDDARLRAWYREYMPLAEIGRRLGRSRGAVHARRIALGLPARRRPWPWPSALDAELIAAARVDRKSTRLNSSHLAVSRMPSSA